MWCEEKGERTQVQREAVRIRKKGVKGKGNMMLMVVMMMMIIIIIIIIIITIIIIRKVLQRKAWILSGGDHCWFKRITRKNRPVTREIIIILIIIIIITPLCCFILMSSLNKGRACEVISVYGHCTFETTRRECQWCLVFRSASDVTKEMLIWPSV